MDNTDPYRPDATTTERADHVISTLLHDEDPVRRYRTVQALQDSRLRDVAAISLRQLRDQHGSTTAAAAAVGISRQAANELLDKAGAPGARQDRAAREQPAYAYGRYLATVCAIGRALPNETQRERAIDHCYTLVEQASQTVSLLPTLTETAAGWLRKIRIKGRPNWSESLTRALDEHGATVAAWSAGRDYPWLTVQEQSEVWLGYHHERVAQARAD